MGYWYVLLSTFCYYDVKKETSPSIDILSEKIQESIFNYYDVKKWIG
jgi:hypothetical protein